MIVVGAFVIILIARPLLRLLIDKALSKKSFLNVQNISNEFLSKKNLIKKNNELQATVDNYNSQILLTDVLRQENESLKKELGRDPAIDKGVLAHVISLTDRSLYETFLIDAGSDEGIKVGQTVYAFDSIALGTISEVEKKHSTVLLFSVSGRTTAGVTQENNVNVTLIGRGGGEYEVRMPRDIYFAVGGLIVYPSITPTILAQVEQIVTDPRDPFQKLIAKIPLNLQTLKWVRVR